jgi:hypothetical protein
MDNALENYKKYPDLTEAYEVVKTVEVVHRRKIYRIEVLKCFSNPPVHYETECWKREWVVLQQGDMTEGKFDNKPENMWVLVQSSLPEVHSDDPERALQQALNFLTGGG